MKYEISYFSKSGNTAVLANAIAAMLPAESMKITDLAVGEVSVDADFHFIGFDVSGGALPLKVMEALDHAEGTAVALFSTCHLLPTEEHKAAIERKIYPFLPDGCDYKGLFLCAGQFPENAAGVVEEKLKTQPDNAEMKEYLKRHYEIAGHPNAHDIENLKAFVQSVLKK